LVKNIKEVRQIAKRSVVILLYVNILCLDYLLQGVAAAALYLVKRVVKSGDIFEIISINSIHPFIHHNINTQQATKRVMSE